MNNVRKSRIQLLLLLAIIGVLLILIINKAVHQQSPRIRSKILGESFEPDYSNQNMK